MLQAYLAKVRTGPVEHWKEYPREGDHKGNVSNNGFRFYHQCHSLFHPNKKVITYSSSEVAPVLAYLFDIPMYSKSKKSGIPEQIASGFERRWFDNIPEAHERFLQKIGGNIGRWYNDGCPAPNLEGYEYGGMKELIERYLLPSVKHIKPRKRSVKR